MSIPNSANYASTTKLWTAVDTYTINSIVLYNGVLYQASAAVTSPGTNPATDTAHWNVLNNYLPAQVAATDSFLVQREALDTGLLAQGNMNSRLANVEQDVLNVLTNTLGGYSTPRTALAARFTSVENGVAAIVALTGAPYAGSALATKFSSLDSQITSIVGLTGAPYASSALNAAITSFTNSINAIVTQSGAPYNGSALASTLTNLQSQITTITGTGYARWRGAWATTTSYVVGDLVRTGTFNNLYSCTTAHTSGTFATDLGAGKWTLVEDFTGAFKKYSIMTTSFTAVAGGSYFLDTATAAAAMNITLPTSPAIGDPPINFTHIDGDVGTYLITLLHGSNNIMGFAEDMTIDKNFASFSLVYSDATRGWRVTIL